MKYSDIEKMLQAGLISPDQGRNIAAHFKLSEQESSRFLTIVSFIGASLVACGIILLIASNWDAIPRGVKIAAGLLLMLGAHGAGWFLRENPGRYPKSGEALYAVGAALFLGNIALLGQIYHLSSRTPNAFLLWWAGIAVLPWTLRSKALHILSLAAFSIWFGTELNERSGPLFIGDETQMLMYALLGMIFLGIGYILRGTTHEEFAGPTEKLGILGLIACVYPLTWKGFSDYSDGTHNAWMFPAMLGVALVVMAFGAARRKELDIQWRWTWASSLAGLAGLMALAYYQTAPANSYLRHEHEWIQWLSTVALFVFLLIEIQVGVQLRSRFMVNIGTAAIAIVITTAYVNLFGSMAQTGLVFLVGGVFLIGLGIYLEKQRRALVRKMAQKL